MRRLLLTGLVVLVAAACGEKSPTDPVDGGLLPPPGGNNGVDGGTTPDAGEPTVTWYEDVLPIVQSSCTGCHIEGGIGPFPLDDYDSAYTHHLAIADAVVQRRMPPWPASEDCIDLQHSRRLPQEQVDLIAQWSAEGAHAGNPDNAPPPPEGPEGLEWVDVELDPGVDYQPNAGVSDDYRCFIVSPSPSQTQDVIGFEVVPGTPTQVHHVILFSVPLSEAQAKDDGEEGPGWTCYGSTGTNEQNVRMIGGWAPGNAPTRVPEGTGVRVGSSSAYVMQVHYNLANGAPQADRTKIRLQYAKTPVPKEAYILPLAVSNFAIPPQSTGYSVKAAPQGLGALPPGVPATIYGITPHMHELGRRMTVRNVTTDTCMIDIPQWDFHWQQSYQYKEPIPFVTGQKLEVECAWDNPGPHTITWGEGTADEMCVAFIYVTL